MTSTGSDIDLPPLRGIDPLHPLQDAYAGKVDELPLQSKPGVYLYMLGDNREGTIYVGATRNLTVRLTRHQHDLWWRRVTQAVIHRIDCQWHEEPCSVTELDLAARALENWLIELFEPTEIRVLGPVS